MASAVGAVLLLASITVNAQLVDNVLKWWKDPFKIEDKTAPAPGQRWDSGKPLKEVPPPKEYGETVDFNEPLSLPQLTEFALLNSPRTRVAWLNARAAAAAVGIASADDFPVITGGWSFSRARPTSGTTGLLANWLNRWGPQISFSYSLYDFGLGEARQQSAEFRLLAANLAQNRTLQEVVFQVEQAYYQLIGIEALVRVNDQAVRNLETALDAARRRRESGVATVADVFRSETQVAQARLTLTRSRGEFEKARGQMAVVVGLPVNTVLRVLPLTAPPQTQDSMRAINDYLDTVKTSRADLAAAQAQVDAARATATATAKASMPSIDISGNTQHSQWHAQGAGNDARTAAQTSAASTATGITQSVYRPSTQTYLFGLNVRIPIFDGFRNNYAQRQAQAQVQIAEVQRDQLYRQTQLEVWQSFYDLQTVNGSINSTEALVKSAEQTAQAVLARYQGGFGTILDLITAQQDETSARTQRIQSYLDWYTVLARLNFAVGAGDLMTTKTETKK